MLAVYTRLQSLLMDIQSEQDDQDQANHSRNNTHKKASIYDIGDPHVAAPRFKRVLLWAHHLLATSKRKDIQAWSSELDVWSLSKTGCVAPACNLRLQKVPLHLLTLTNTVLFAGTLA